MTVESGDGPRASVVDWNQVRQRLAAVEEWVARGGEPTPDEAKAILRRRARALARESEQEKQEAGRQFLVFQLGTDRYGIETQFVQEVYPVGQLTSVPGAAPFVRGVASIRGQIITMIDLAHFLGRYDHVANEVQHALMVARGGAPLGWLVDAIDELENVPDAAVRPVPPTRSGRVAGYLTGMTAQGLLLLDGRALLENDRLTAGNSGNVSE